MFMDLNEGRDVICAVTSFAESDMLKHESQPREQTQAIHEPTPKTNLVQVRQRRQYAMDCGDQKNLHAK